MRVLVLNGPNLGRLGRRQPELYGTTTHGELGGMCRAWGRELGLDVEVRQTNHEGQMLDWLGEAADHQWPVVLNAAAWSHYSWAVADACAMLEAPLVEVHITDPMQRPEAFRHTSVVTPYAIAVVAGQGVEGYRTALQKLRAATPEPPPMEPVLLHTEPPVEPEPEPEPVVDDPVAEESDPPPAPVEGGRHSHRADPADPTEVR
jgi:3-dehydroquinate dehydratase-2